MKFRPVAELPLAGEVYAEGWQTWSEVSVYRPGQVTRPPRDRRERTLLFQPGKGVPPGVIQGEGVLAVATPDGPARAWFAPDPAREVPTLRLGRTRDRWELSADGDVDEVGGETLARALEGVGDRLRIPRVRSVAPGWSSWSCYFKHVSEEDVMENVGEARRLELPVGVAQLDDGYEAAIGDWLDVRPGFGSLDRLAQRVSDMGMQAGIWIAPFLVSPRSRLAQEHPEFLLRDATAGEHWGEEMRVLDIAHEGAADHLRRVFLTFAGWGYTLFKLDFLYAGAIPGLERYREGMLLIREAAGPDAVLLFCGAPLLPSIGLCDVMRVGPDVLPEVTDNPQIDLASTVRVTDLRRWMNGRLWLNDPDCLVARPAIEEREAWAAHLHGYGGLRWSSDRLSSLDARGLELTRRHLAAGGPAI